MIFRVHQDMMLLHGPSTETFIWDVLMSVEHDTPMFGNTLRERIPGFRLPTSPEQTQINMHVSLTITKGTSLSAAFPVQIIQAPMSFGNTIPLLTLGINLVLLRIQVHGAGPLL